MLLRRACGHADRLFAAAGQLHYRGIARKTVPPATGYLRRHRFAAIFREFRPGVPDANGE